MKKRNLIHPGGILYWSTAFILASGVMGMTSCDSSVRTVMEDNGSSKAEAEKRVAEVDTVQTQLESGMVENNFQIPKLGYYHAAAHGFYEFPYNQYKEGQWYVNGTWQADAGVENISASRPSPEELKRVDAALADEQENVAQNPQTAHAGGGGFGMGNMLMMYWLLSGNRGFFSPGAGFQQASGQADQWKRNWKDERRQATPGSRAGSSSFGSYRKSSSPSSIGDSSPSTSSRSGFGSRSSGSSFGS